MKIVISVGCRRQIVQRLERLHRTEDTAKMPGVRVTSPETLRILEEEAGFCRFEVERLLNRCLRNKGADCNVVSGCFITAKKFGVVGGVDYQVSRVIILYVTCVRHRCITHFTYFFVANWISN